MRALFLVVLFLFNNIALADVYVRGYYKKNGTYVQPHHRSNPNSSVYDNWSTRGNTNPYTGDSGHKSPSSIYNSKSLNPINKPFNGF